LCVLRRVESALCTDAYFFPVLLAGGQSDKEYGSEGCYSATVSQQERMQQTALP